MIEILKKKTIEKCGFSMLTLGDCQKLSNHILEFQDDFISYNTLRRFFNVIHNDIKPSENTLNILSRFNGYNDYNSFSLLFKFMEIFQGTQILQLELLVCLVLT